MLVFRSVLTSKTSFFNHVNSILHYLLSFFDYYISEPKEFNIYHLTTVKTMALTGSTRLLLDTGEFRLSEKKPHK